MIADEIMLIAYSTGQTTAMLNQN